MPLYKFRTKRTFQDVIQDLYVWEFYVDAPSESMARDLAVREFIHHIQDFQTTMEDLKNNEVKRALTFKKNDGLEPLYYAALGEYDMEEVAKGLLIIQMSPVQINDPPF